MTYSRPDRESKIFSPDLGQIMDRISFHDNLIKRRRAHEMGIPRRQRRKDVQPLRGQRFGRLTILCLAPIELSGAYTATWICRCDCGNITFARTDKLKIGQKKSCGCMQREASRRNIQIANASRWR